MKFTLGKEGLEKTWQAPFKEEVECVHCKGPAQIAFVAHEGLEPGDKSGPFVCEQHPNEGPGGYWLHDCCAVAVYFCRDCLRATAVVNQG